VRSIRIWQASCSPRVGLAGVAVALVVFALGVGASRARPAGSDQITIGALLHSSTKPAFDVLIPNFERYYPQITVVPSYAPGFVGLYQQEAIELAAGNAPPILETTAGCGAPDAICVLVKAGDLAQMIGVPWAKRQPRLLTSLEKHGAGLFAFTAGVSAFGMFTDDPLFARLGLKVPETFAQLLAVCQKAKVDGTIAVELDATNPTGLAYLVYALAATTVYRTDPHWNSELNAGKVTFVGSPGWHEALQKVVDMKNAGCFPPLGDTAPHFAQGQALMSAVTSGQKAILDAAKPQFPDDFHLFPAGDSLAATEVMIGSFNTFSVNAHSSPAQQAAAQTFINFLARPAQDALYAQIKGNLSPDELLRAEPPPFMSSLAAPLAAHDYRFQASTGWWNAGIQTALEEQALGLFTGQSTIDGILAAMDAAWKQGPS
jgi:raffinose/stachyose/melibiose transport system substrate-binding protein